jgi:hypothetical protein
MHLVALVLIASLAAAKDGLTFTEVQVGDGRSFAQGNNCTAYHTLINYKRTQMHILPLLGPSTFMWTNKRFDECNANTFDSCPLSSVICGMATGEHPLDINIGTCTDELYMYVWDPEHAHLEEENRVENVEFIVIYKELEKACDSVEESDLAMCGAMSEAQCDICDGECRVATCIEKRGERVQGYMCLPANTTDEEITDRCTAFKNNNSGGWKRVCDMTVRTGDVGALYAFISSVLILAYLCLCVSVFWYNFYMKRAGRPPVHCPRFCPDLLFPRITEAQQPTVRSSSYQPPEFYSDH